MKIRRLLFSLLTIALIVPTVSCAARQPSVKKSQHLIERHFNRYARKYPESVFGNSKVSDVNVLNTSELHKHYVHVIADVNMDNGASERVRAAIEKKPPLGWRIVAWERAMPGWNAENQ